MIEIPPLLDLIVSALRMVAVRQYIIEPYEEIMEIYERMNEFVKNGIPFDRDLQMYTDQQIVILMKEIIVRNFGVRLDEIGTTIRENASFPVFNPMDGTIMLVYFSAYNKATMPSDVFNKLMKMFSECSRLLIGTSDFENIESLFRGVVITKSVLGTNPKEKLEAIGNISVVHQDTVLAIPFDNVLQPQITLLTEDEERAVFSDTGLTSSDISSIGYNGAIAGYLGIQKGVMRVDRKNFDGEFLDTSISYRLCK